MNDVDKNLGHATAYGYAKSKGYTGTEEEFAELMADYADVGQAAVDAALAAKASEDAAKASETAAEASETAAATSAGTATTAAQTATGAAQTATTKASEATTAATTATTKAAEAAQSATEAAASATTAGTAATNAQTAQTAAEAAQTAAETAQGAAEDAAESVEGKAAQIDQNTEDISLLKSHLNAVEIVDNASGAIATFADGSDGVPVRGLTVTMEPIQDLHGQANPYPAGGGKNLFNTDFANTTINGTTITKLSDGKVSTSGVPSSAFDFIIGTTTLSAGSYILNGCPANGGALKYRLQVTDYPVVNNLGQDDGNSVSFTLSESMTVAVRVQIYTGAPASLTFAPMIRKSTETDATFAPYSNICPISGRQSVTVTRTGTNVWSEKWEPGGISSSTGANTVANNAIRAKNLIPVKPGTDYYVAASGTLYLFYYDASGTYIGSSGGFVQPGVRTLGDNVYYIRFQTNSSYGTTYKDDISINYPSTVSAYNPHDIQSVTVQLGQTVYGGHLDVTSGVLTVDRAIVDLGTLTWSSPATNIFRTNDLASTIKQGTSPYAKLICSQYKTVQASNWASGTNDVITSHPSYSMILFISRKKTQASDS